MLYLYILGTKVYFKLSSKIFLCYDRITLCVMTESHEFDPIKEEDGKRARRIVWSTATLDKAIRGVQTGRRLKANPFWENNIRLLKADLPFRRTPEEIEEWKHCAQDIVYFAETYCKVMTPEGNKLIVLRDYQKEYFELLKNHRLTILCAARQIGKTVTSALHMLHYLCFNVDKTALVVGNRNKTSIEILRKIKEIYYELPFFLRPGIYKWNETEISLDNGSRLVTDTCTDKPALGFTVHCCLIDEFAHVRETIADQFYTNIFPTLQAAQGKIIICSTQGGYNLFYRLFTAAEAGLNDYAPMKINWDRVPEWNPDKHVWEKRDMTWKLRQIGNLGSLSAFNSQFGCDFDISADTLIDKDLVGINRGKTVEFVNAPNTGGIPYGSHWYWVPDLELEDINTERLVVTCDLAEGGGNDSTVFSIYKLSGEVLECIGFFKANNVPLLQCAGSLLYFLINYTDQTRTLLSVEWNTYGELFIRNLRELNDREGSRWDDTMLVRYDSNRKDIKVEGIRLNRANKLKACLLFKKAYETEKTINKSVQFMNELFNFCDNGKGSYEAQLGHDDMVMTAVQLEFVKETLQYKNLYILESTEKEPEVDIFTLMGSMGASQDSIYRVPEGYPI